VYIDFMLTDHTVHYLICCSFGMHIWLSYFTECLASVGFFLPSLLQELVRFYASAMPGCPAEA